jgi:energy-coupling factor transport system permease protein
MLQTAFSRLHPITTILYFIGVISLSMILQHPVYLLVGLLSCVIVYSLYLKFSKRILSGYLLMLTLMMVLNPIFVRNGSTVLFSVFHVLFTLEAIMYGLKSGILIVIMLVTFSIFNRVVSSSKLLFLFSKSFPKGVMLLALALRFVPLFKSRIQQIDEVQATKGLSVREGSIGKRVKAGMIYIQVLLSYSLEEALQTADSMKARGYTGKHSKRTAYKYYRLSNNDIITMVFLLICIFIVITGTLNGFGDFNYFPVMESASLKTLDIIFLGAYVSLVGLPIIIEGGSRIRWHFLNLRT